jgi:hypothetical protein
VAFDKNPDQRDLLEDFDGRIIAAVEEFVRNGSPLSRTSSSRP